MADNYTHRYNARNAIKLAGYAPRSLNSFIMGANGPDPLFCYQMYNPMRKYRLSKLGSVMHNEKTGIFLRNLFRLAQTDAQKDYCLGFLCHYTLDSVIHPYVNYVTTAYGSPYNIPSGHGYFESALDSMISKKLTQSPAAAVEFYCPALSKMELNQIVSLFKKAVDATYKDFRFPKSEYLQAFKDFAFIKGFFYSPKKFKFLPALLVEKLLGFEEGFVTSHMQPCERVIPPFPFWENLDRGLYCVDSLEELLRRADGLSAQAIDIGLNYFKGIYSIDDFVEDIGCKSYETGLTVIQN